MILWITLSSMLALLIFLLTRWIGISLERDQSGVTVVASFSKLKFSFQPGDSSKKTGKRKSIKKPEAKPDEEGRDRKKKNNLENGIGWLRLLADIFSLAKRVIKFLGRHGRVARLEIRGMIGTDDPYLTGTLAGVIETLKGIFTQSFPSARIEVRPEFGEKKLELAGILGVEIRLIHLVFLIILILWKLPKRRVWKLARNS